MNLKTFKTFFFKFISHAQTQFLYQQNAHFMLYYLRVLIFSSIQHYIIFYGYKGQLVNHSVIFTNFKKS